MRSPACPGVYRLSFMFPKGITANPGEYADWVPGCVVHIDRVSAAIVGRSRESLFEQAARVLRVICQGKGALSIAAVLESPAPGSGQDSWTIIVGADIAFAPTSLGATFPAGPSHAAAPAEMQGA